MVYDPRRSRFTLVNGGLKDEPALEGPITRLGLGDRFAPVSAKTWTILVATKVAALASILYYYWG